MKTENAHCQALGQFWSAGSRGTWGLVHESSGESVLDSWTLHVPKMFLMVLFHRPVWLLTLNPPPQTQQVQRNRCALSCPVTCLYFLRRLEVLTSCLPFYFLPSFPNGCVLSACMYVCSLHVYRAFRHQQRVCNSEELELQGRWTGLRSPSPLILFCHLLWFYYKIIFQKYWIFTKRWWVPSDMTTSHRKS